MTGALVAVAVLLAAAAGAGAQATSPLSAARYTTLDTLYTFSVGLERKPTPQLLARLGSYCATIDRADPLLAVLRSNCELSIAATKQGHAFAACGSRMSCLRRATPPLHATIARLTAVVRKADRVVVTQVVAGSCRTALRDSPDVLRSDEILLDGLAGVQRALRSGSQPALKRAHRRLETAARVQAEGPSSARQRKAFRAACGPPPAGIAPAPPAPLA
jgi:hypothetical protein